MLDFGKALQIGVGLQLGGQGTVGAQKKNGRFFQPLFALGRDDFGPPIVAGEILAGEGELFEIILQARCGSPQSAKTLRISVRSATAALESSNSRRNPA
jgi:hypothetical protein